MKRDQSANRIPQSSIEIVMYTERKERRERDRESSDSTINDVILFRRKNENIKRERIERGKETAQREGPIFDIYKEGIVLEH